MATLMDGTTGGNRKLFFYRTEDATVAMEVNAIEIADRPDDFTCEGECFTAWVNAPRVNWRAIGAALREAHAPTAKPVESKPLLIGRNERCPCQSGKKWKRCCKRS